MTGRAWTLPFATLLGLLSLAAGGLAQNEPPLRITATVGMIGDMAQVIGGDCVEVTTLMGPGVDPHLYRASAGDVRTLSQSDLILYGGLNLEGQLDDVLTALRARRPTLAVMESLQADRLLESPVYRGQYDPHLWMDAGLWAETIPAVVEALSSQRTNCREQFEANAAAYRRQLEALHAWAEATLASIPEPQRVLVTAHDAFNYFGRAYDVQVAGIQGISTEAEAALADIREVVDLVVARRIPAIFVESSISGRTIEAVRAAARDQGHPVALGGQLFSDAMGERDTPEGTYIGMIRHNVLTITEALGGEAAAWPQALAEWAARWGII